MPRAVLDTNVLISALISPRGTSAALLVELRDGAFELIVSPRLLSELDEVLRRDKFRRYATVSEIASYVDLIRHQATIVDDPPPNPEPLSPDPDDEYLVSLARAARAHALVSGDGHLLGLRDRLSTITPADFLAALDD